MGGLSGCECASMGVCKFLGACEREVGSLRVSGEILLCECV